ncbi:MAG TPA: hypothetical protein VEX87_00760 [Skermanella sp.]|nr:hypothetical protein [Skermanella sp.]
MVRYALGNGLKLPPALQQSLELFENVVEEGDPSVPVAYLASLHGQLADVVAPATPRTIYLLHIDKSRNGWASILGPLSSIRRLVLGAAFFTMVFVLSSLSDSISHQNLSMDIYSLDGMASLEILIFLMSAAAMGGCFHALFIAHKYIEQGTYDPRFESSYWMRIGLGIIAGLVLSQMIPIGPGPEAGADAAAPVSSASVFGKPLLALLGGFSATLVYTILQRLVETVESLFTQRQAPTAGSRVASDTMALSAAPDVSVPAPAPATPAATPTPAAMAADDAKPAGSAGPISAAAASAAALAAATTAIATATAATIDSGTETAPAAPPADEAATLVAAPVAPEASDAAPVGQVDAPAAAVEDPTTLKSA